MSDPNYIRAEAKSSEILEIYGITNPGFDVFDLAYALGVDVEFGGVENADAFLIKRRNGRGKIRLRSGISNVCRQRFSIAHEIGHWVLHENIQQGYLCTAQDLSDYTKSPEEAEANWFAATLLMPRQWIPQCIVRKDPNFEVIRQLASDFKTSLTASARRIVELSHQPVLLVCASDGKVDWAFRSKAASSFFIRPKTAIPEHSGYWKSTTAEQTHSSDLIQLPTDVWFEDRTFYNGSELFEQVYFFKELKIALILLWIPR